MRPYSLPPARSATIPRPVAEALDDEEIRRLRVLWIRNDVRRMIEARRGNFGCAGCHEAACPACQAAWNRADSDLTLEQEASVIVRRAFTDLGIKAPRCL